MSNLRKYDLYKEGYFKAETVEELLKLNDDAFIEDVIQTFKEESPKYLKQVRECFQARDYERMRISLHQLKGSCGTIGAEKVRRFVMEMMEKVDKGRISSLQQDCEQLEKLLVDLYEMLDIVYERK
ncbi:MAG: Hpt domain-containing protein [Cytophagales bacterium]|nr:Hpt domain-containing protein [Cytophagales bacterium]MDW8384691.1 Hpt domain-containing protein [Flammeovirgaceae bacterium]